MYEDIQKFFFPFLQTYLSGLIPLYPGTDKF
jgi:hypothetical protein